MSGEAVKDILINGLSNFGLAMVSILGAVLVVAVGFLVFKIGWGWVSDKSYSIGGYYLHNLPYRGYKRFRSRKWNMEHME